MIPSGLISGGPAHAKQSPQIAAARRSVHHNRGDEPSGGSRLRAIGPPYSEPHEAPQPMTTRVALLAATCLPWHRFGGLERHVFQLASWLRERGVEVDLYLSAPEHDVDPFAGDAGFRLEIVPGTPFARRRGAVVISRSTLYPLFSLRMGRRVVAAAKSRAYAAVIAQGLTGFGYATLAGRRPT